MDYRFKHSFNVGLLPKPFVSDDRGLEECCDEFLVLAYDGTDSEKNDSEIVYIKKTGIGDIANFEIRRCGEDTLLDNLGTEVTFPDDPLAVAFIYDWKQYLEEYGAGVYVIKRVYIIADVEGEDTWGRYKLLPFTTDTSQRTTRLKTIFDSYSLPDTINWTGSNAFSTIRVYGKFWSRKPNTVVRTPIDRGRVARKTFTENVNSYLWETDGLREMETRKIIDFHLRDGDEFFMSDCNIINHSYFYKDKPVTLSTQSAPEMEEMGRLATIKVTWEDRVKNQKSYYSV